MAEPKKSSKIRWEWKEWNGKQSGFAIFVHGNNMDGTALSPKDADLFDPWQTKTNVLPNTSRNNEEEFVRKNVDFENQKSLFNLPN